LLFSAEFVRKLKFPNKSIDALCNLASCSCKFYVEVAGRNGFECGVLYESAWFRELGVHDERQVQKVPFCLRFCPSGAFAVGAGWRGGPDSASPKKQPDLGNGRESGIAAAAEEAGSAASKPHV